MVLVSYIEPVLLYGSESWTISKIVRNYLEAAEMWFYIRMMRIPWMDKKRNEDELRETNSRRELVNRIRRRQSAFFGHVMRRGGFEYYLAGDRVIWCTQSAHAIFEAAHAIFEAAHAIFEVAHAIFEVWKIACFYLHY